MIDDVLRELESVGTVDSVGEFTMDRAKAREKMRRFQLADPRSYVLELVQAASLKGASRIRFDIDSRDMQMQFDGRPFTAEDFDDIYGAAFTRRLDHEVLARRQLALGVNSAMALRPTRITVESGDGTKGARLTLEQGVDDAYEAIETERVGTLIHVRERFSLGTFVAFFKNMRGRLAEEQLLRERCGFASFEIDLEGQRLDRGLRLPDNDVLEMIETRSGTTLVVCGLRRERKGVAWADIIKDGVWISTHRLPVERFGPGFQAVVQDHALRKDVSQSDVVRDDAYARMLDIVEQGLHTAHARLAEGFEGDGTPRWAEEALMQQMLRLTRGGRLLASNDPTGLAPALLRLPLWETTTKTWLSLEDLLREQERHGSLVYVCEERYQGTPMPGHSFVLFFDLGRGILRKSMAVFEDVFDGRIRNVSEELEQRLANEKAREAWRARPMKPVLPEAGYLARRSFSGAGVRGELGLTSMLSEQARISFVVDGCLLHEEEIELPLLGLRVVVEADAFKPASSFGHIVPTAAACAVVLGIIAELGPLYAMLPSPGPSSHWVRACAMSFLETALRGDDLGEALANELGLDPSGVAAARGRIDKEDLTLSLSLNQGTGERHPVVEMPLFRTLKTEYHSLVGLSARARAGGRLMAVHKVVPAIDADILVIEQEQREILEPLFPGGIADGWPEVNRIKQHNEFLARFPQANEINLASPGVVVAIEGDGIGGLLGVMPRPGHLVRRQSIPVLHQDRPIDSVDLLLVGFCTGWVESSKLQPKTDYSGVQSGNALDAVRVAVLRAFARACVQIAEEAEAQMSEDRRAFLQEVVALMFPSRAFRLVFDRIAKTKGVPQATVVKIYRWLYAGLAAAEDTAEFEQRLWRLTRSKTPVGDAISIPVPKRAIRWALAAVDILFPPGDEPHAFAKRALNPAPPLGALALLERHDGRTISIDELRTHVDSQHSVLYIEERHAIDLGNRMMVITDEVLREQLRRVLGGKNLLNGEGVIERERNKRALETRPQEAQFTLTAGRALVSIRIDVEGDGHTTEGEVGLVREHPNNPQRKPQLMLMAHQKRRRITNVTVKDRPFELLASINDDRFLLSFDHKDIRRGRIFDSVVARCEEVVPQLIGSLVARWSGLTPGMRSSAWRHVLDFLVARRPSKPETWLDESALDPMEAVVVKLPGFPVVGGALVSLAQLVTVERERGCVEVLPPPAEGWGRSPFGPDRPIVCADAYELGALQTLLGTVESALDRWAAMNERKRRYEESRSQVLPRPEDSLVVVEVHGPIVEGRLAIRSNSTILEIDLCAEGRVVESRFLEGVLPCQGSISGTGIVPNETWFNASVDQDAIERLAVAAIELYRALIGWFQTNLADDRREWVASLLSRRVVELRRMELGGTLAPALGSLLDELRPLGVLPVGSGRRISLQTALEERPGALAHLNLWESFAHRLLQSFDERDAKDPESSRLPPPPPPPEPEVREPTPEERLLDDIRAELELVRGRNRALLTHVHLDRIEVKPLSGRRRSLVAFADASGVVVNRKHPVVERALAMPGDPVWRSYLSSAVYTALNVWLEEVTDTDEMHFLGLMGRLVGGG